MGELNSKTGAHHGLEKLPRQFNEVRNHKISDQAKIILYYIKKLSLTCSPNFKIQFRV